MIDLIGAIFGGALFVLLAGTIAVYLPRDLATRWLVAATLWGAAVVTLTAAGLFAPGATGGLPGPVLAFVITVAALFGAFAVSPRFRDALLSMPFAVISGLNIARVGGAFFLFLLAEQRLSAPFAPSAGWGDVITGLVAIPLTFTLLRNPERSGWPVALWNAFGTLDLIVAVSLGALSAPGTPFQMFTAAPGTAALSTLPWILIPTLFVPTFLLLHFTVAAKLRRQHRAGAAALTHAM